ncbi:YitT family protein [Motilibacter deserti]|uniref:YitT family protein n=1 Tax=Motilibacter deserti TaxID=2714956 RepID=A0ABX0GR87_9ACTN|nr:YitT family protein [Motilibacter deserti]NHC13369.1 YitT family protein [Motilibacter deserti]
MIVDSVARPAPEAAPPPRHSAVEDLVSLVTGAFLASLGLFLIDTAGAVTGGTAGVGLLLGHALPVPFAAVYVAVNSPFLLLAGLRKGWGFAVRSVVATVLVTAFLLLHPHAMSVSALEPVYGALVGNLSAGVGMLILFRHRASLGGFNVVALLAQERLGWRAGYVQLALDACVLALSALVLPAGTVLVSVAGALVVNLVLAMNHRPGRYLGA